MASRSRFWLHIHNLAEDIEPEGDGKGERLANLTASFYDMSPTARQEVEKALKAVHDQLPDSIAVACSSEDKEHERQINSTSLHSWRPHMGYLPQCRGPERSS